MAKTSNSGGLRVLRKTVDSYPKRAATKRSRTPSLSWNELASAVEEAETKARQGWKDLSVDKTVSRKGVVRRKNLNYGRDTQSKLLPKLIGVKGPLYSLNRNLGLSEINQGLIKLNAGDLPASGIKVAVHLPQVNQVIEAYIQPEFRFGKGLRRSKLLKQVTSGKKRMVLTELGSDSPVPQLQITFY